MNLLTPRKSLFYIILFILLFSSSCQDIARILANREQSTYFEAAAISPDGKIVATSWRNEKTGLVTLWSVETGQRIKELIGHKKTIGAVIFSPDGKLLATSSRWDNVINIWSVDSAEIIQTIELSRGPEIIAFSPDSRQLAYTESRDSRNIYIWSIPDSKITQSIKTNVYRLGVVIFLSGSESLLAVGEREVKIFSLKTGEMIKSFWLDEDDVRAAALSQDEKHLAVIFFDSLRLVSLETYKTEKAFDIERELLYTLAFSHDGKMLAGAPEGSGYKPLKISVWSTETGDLVKELEGHLYDYGAPSRIWTVAFTPDDKALISVGMEKSIKIQSVETGKLIKIINEQPVSSESPAFVEDESYDFRRDERIRHSDSTKSGNPIATDEQITLRNKHTLRHSSQKILSVAIDPESKVVASGLINGEIILTSIEMGEQIRTFRADDGAINTLQFYDNLVLVVGGANGTIRFIDTSEGSLIKSVKCHSKPINSLNLHTGKGILVSGSSDGLLKIWSLAPLINLADNPLQLIHEIKGCDENPSDSQKEPFRIMSVCLNHDGSIVASGGTDKKVKIWSTDTGVLLSTLDNHEAAVNCVKFSNVGNLLASGGDDNRAIIWDIRNLESPVILHDLWGHMGAVATLSFSADDTILACSDTKMLRLWWVDNGEHHSVYKAHDDIMRSLAFSADGNYLVTVGDDKQVIIWQLKNYFLKDIQKRGYGFASVDYHPDGDIVACGTHNNTIEIISIKDDKVVRILPGPVSSVKFSPDGNTLAACGINTVNFWNYKTGNLIKSIQCGSEGHYVKRIDYGPDGKSIAIGVSETIEIVDTSNWKILKSFSEVRPVDVLKFNPDGKYIVSGTESDLAKLWEVASGKLIHKFGAFDGHYHYVIDASFLPDKKHVAIATWNGFSSGVINIYDIATGESIKSFTGISTRFESMTCSSDGKYLAAGEYMDGIKVWSAESGKLLYEFEGTGPNSGCIIFSPDSELLLAPGSESVVRLWLIK